MSAIATAAQDILPPIVGTDPRSPKAFTGTTFAIEIPDLLQGLFAEMQVHGSACVYGFAVIPATATPPVLTPGGVSTFAAPSVNCGLLLGSGEARQFKIPQADVGQKVWLVAASDAQCTIRLACTQGTASF